MMREGAGRARIGMLLLLLVGRTISAACFFVQLIQEFSPSDSSESSLSVLGDLHKTFELNRNVKNSRAAPA